MFILHQLCHKNAPCSATYSLGNLKAQHKKGVFLTLAGHHFPRTRPQTQLSIQGTSVDINRTNPQIPISARHQLQASFREQGQQQFVVEHQATKAAAGGACRLRADRTSTNSICLFWHSGRKEEPDNPAVVKNYSPAWNS